MAESLRILGLASDDAGCGHYRLINPLRALSDLGYDTTWTLNPSEFESLCDRFDVLLLQRVALPWRDRITEWSRSGKLVIYELDDLIHEVPDSSPVRRLYQQGSTILKNSVANMSACDGMIVSTLELERYYRRFNRNILRIPNFIDFRLRDWDTPYPRIPGRLAVGWTGGSHHQEEAPLLLEILRWVSRRYPLDIILYCHPHFAAYLLTRGEPIPPDRLIVLPARLFQDYPRAVGAMDIGLAPLTNIAFNRARCLHRDTAVWSPSGIRTVGSLRVGDWVWNGERYVHVIAVHEEGWCLGLSVRLECGLNLSLTTDHRVLTSIGWLNAGKLRRGDVMLLSPPHYPGGFVKHDAHRVALMFGLLHLHGNGGVRKRAESELGMKTEFVKSLVKEDGESSLFEGWSDCEASVFFDEFVRWFAYSDSSGRPVIRLKYEGAQRLAEFALIAGRRLRAEYKSKFVKFTVEDGPRPTCSKVVDIRSCWLDAVDIQVEGELFCANGVVSHNSALKPLEYMARGVVCVASDIAEYRLLQREGAPLLLARELDDWKRHLSALIEDEGYRRSLQVPDWVIGHYDLHANAERYIDAIRQFHRWKQQGIRGRGEVVHLRHHDRCPCGSGLKYSRCCYPAFG